MTRPLAPAEVPAWAWTSLRALKEMRGQRLALIKAPFEAGPRSIRALLRRERIREITADILRHETRLAAAGIDCLGRNIADQPTRAYCDTEH